MANTLNLGNGNWGVKKDSLLGYNSENGNYKPLPFDFTRASSATVVNKAGLIETVGSGQPRIDFQGNTNGALLLEPQRTNLITNSNFQSGWSVLSGGSITQNQSISPDGTQNAAILSGNGVGANAAYTTIVTSPQTYTYSVFAKKITQDIFKILGFSGGANGSVEFNLSNGTIETEPTLDFSNAKIEDYGNGWYRCSANVNVTVTGSHLFGFNREAIVSGDLFSVYAVQFEEGSYATSYIPTQGSTVTRLADVCDDAGNEQMINSTEGTLYAEISALANDGTNRMISLSNGVSTTSNATLYFTTTTNQIRFVYEVSSVLQCSIISTIDVLQDNKFAIVYKLNRFELWGNGVKLGEDTSGSVNPSGTFTKLSFLRGASQLPFYGKAKALAVYNTALTDSELQQLTTI